MTQDTPATGLLSTPKIVLYFQCRNSTPPDRSNTHMPPPTPMAGLLTASSAGDQAAQARLLARLEPYLWALARRRAGLDVTPDVVGRTLDRLRDYLSGQMVADVPSLLDWAGAVVAEQVVAGRQPVHLPTAQPGDFPPSHVQAERDETAVWVAAALITLPDIQRRAVDLRFVDELIDPEAAARLSVSTDVLRQVQLRAVRAVKATLEGSAVSSTPDDNPAGLSLDRLLAGAAADPDGLAGTVADLRAFAASVRRHAAADPLPAAGSVPDPFPGEYRFRRVLGRGNFGTVWLADEVWSGRSVALKTLRVADTGRLAALHNEARLLINLDHRNLIKVYTWRTAGADHYLVMQYVAGGSLADRVGTGGSLPWQDAVRYAADVGEALVVMHAAQLVHRDVKPDNVLWDTTRNEAVLTDLGLAARLGAVDSFGGTKSYMSPEVIAGRVDPAGDVYALAATLFVLATGETPFPRATPLFELPDVIRQGLPDPDTRLSKVPETVDWLLRAGLAADVWSRPILPAFVAGLRGALNQLLADDLARTGGGLRLTAERWTGGGFAAMASVKPSRPMVTRDLKAVPAAPATVGLRTGDRVRVRVVSDQPGWVTVFNVGPTGNLNLLLPATAVTANVPVDAMDSTLTPPAGRERVFAVWTRQPRVFDAAALMSVAEADVDGTSRPYRATRDLQAIQQSVSSLPAGDRAAAVLELDHQPA